MGDPGEVAGAESLVQHEPDLTDGLAGPRADHGRPEDVAARVHHAASHPADLALGDGAVKVTVLPLEHPQAGRRGMGGDADRRDLGPGEGDPRITAQIDLAPQSEDRVAGGQAAVDAGGMGELRMAGQVARGPDPGVAGAQPGVDPDEAAAVQVHPGVLQTQIFGPW